MYVYALAILVAILTLSIPADKVYFMSKREK